MPAGEALSGGRRRRGPGSCGCHACSRRGGAAGDFLHGEVELQRQRPATGGVRWRCGVLRSRPAGPQHPPPPHPSLLPPPTPPSRRWWKTLGRRACEQQSFGRWLRCSAVPRRIPAVEAAGRRGGGHSPWRRGAGDRVSPARRAPDGGRPAGAALAGAPSCDDNVRLPSPCEGLLHQVLRHLRSAPASMVFRGHCSWVGAKSLRCQRRRPRVPFPPWRRW